MTVVASIDHLISRLEAFKATANAAQLSMNEGEFAKSLSDATMRLDAAMAQEVASEVVADEPQALLECPH